MKVRVPFILALLLAVLFQPVPAVAQEEPGVAMHHVILNPAGTDRLSVREQVIITNPGTTSWSPAAPLRFNLPAGAASLAASGSVEVQAGEGYVEVAGPLPPGMAQISFSYELTSDIPHFDLSRAFAVSTPEIYFFVPGTGEIVLAGEGVNDLGLADVSGTRYRAFSVANIGAGETVPVVAFVGAPGPGTSGGTAPIPDQSPAFHSPAHIRFWQQSPFAGINAHLFLAIVIGVPVALLIYYLRQRTKQLPEAGAIAGDEAIFQRLRAREQVLLRRLREVEDKFATQQMAEDEYRRMRELYKQKLVEVKLQLRRFT